MTIVARSFWWPLAGGLAMFAALAPRVFPGTTAVLLAAALLLVVWRSAAGRNDPVLTTVVLAAFAVRLVLAVAVYYISAWRLPVFPDFQTGDGFWSFLPDTPRNHQWALLIFQNWTTGSPLPRWITGAVEVDYYVLVAFFYYVFGPHPLNAILVNVGAGALTGLLGYLIAERFWGRDAGRSGAALVAFWPSSIFWSTQILKDTLLIGFLLAVFYLLIRLVEPGRGGVHAQGIGPPQGFQLLGLGAFVFSATRLRSYVGMAIVAAAFLAIPVFVGVARLRRRPFRPLRLVGVSLALALSVGLALAVSPKPILSLAFEPEPAVAARPSTDATQIKRAEGGAVVALSPAPSAPPPAEVPSVLVFIRELGRRVGDLFRAMWAAVLGLNPLRYVKVPYLEALTISMPSGILRWFFAPYPWQWSERGIYTGVPLGLAAPEVVLLYALLVQVLRGVWRTTREASFSSLSLVLFAVIVILLQALVLTNAGTLFRGRLMGLLPLLILASGQFQFFANRAQAR